MELGAAELRGDESAASEEPAMVERLLVAGMVLAAALEAGTNPVLVNSCADGPNVGPFTLPLTTDPFALTEANFDLSGAGCSGTSNINDAVLCFAPQYSCTLTIECVDADLSLFGAGQYLNLFQARCVDAPDSCLAWDFDSSHTVLTDVAVVAGQRYCVVCQDLYPPRVLTVSLTATAGDCGLIDNSIFEDGFASGGTGAWSAAVP